MVQHDLFEAPAAGPRAGKTIQDRFEAFHRENPWVYDALERLVAEAVAAGRERVGIKMAWEAVRWREAGATTDREFKVNNNYHSRYVRLLIERRPEWAGLFELRAIKSE